MTKEELRKELEDVKTLYVVGIGKDKDGIWSRFRVYYVKDGELKQLYFSPDEKEYPPHWKPRKRTRDDRWTGGYFVSNVIGSDRVFEIVYGIGQWLYGDGNRFRSVFLSYGP